jgi:hypothetical protein
MAWLNFTLVVLVGLHLALNWDWLAAVLKRRRPERPALTEATGESPGANSRRHSMAFVKLFERGLVVFFAAVLSAGFVYLAMAAMLRLPEARTKMQSTPGMAAPSTVPRSQLAPQPRPASWPHGAEQFMGTLGVVIFTMIIGRYIFRLGL